MPIAHVGPIKLTLNVHQAEELTNALKGALPEETVHAFSSPGTTPNYYVRIPAGVPVGILWD